MHKVKLSNNWWMDARPEFHDRPFFWRPCHEEFGGGGTQLCLPKSKEWNWCVRYKKSHEIFGKSQRYCILCSSENSFRVQICLRCIELKLLDHRWNPVDHWSISNYGVLVRYFWCHNGGILHQYLWFHCRQAYHRHGKHWQNMQTCTQYFSIIRQSRLSLDVKRIYLRWFNNHIGCEDT